MEEKSELSEFEWRKLAGFVKYEYWMMNDTWELLQTNFAQVAPLSQQRCVHNAILESYLIHVRVLLEFFGDKPKRFDDDLRASDFVPGWRIDGNLLPTSTNKSTGRQIDQSLAHLTRSRLHYASKKAVMQDDAFRGEINRVWDIFVASLPSERREWFAA